MPGIKVKLIKSVAGASVDQKATLAGLGLYKFGAERILPDNPSTIGACAKLRHLVVWERVQETPKKRNRNMSAAHKKRQAAKAEAAKA